MTDIIKSQVFATGTKFTVTDETKDSTFGPGTTGFITYVKGRDQDFGNVIYYRAAIIKRGKTGKERLEMSDISTPVFDLEDENIHHILPDEKRRYYVHIRPLIHPENVMDMEDMDFLAYAFAYSRWVRKLNTRAKHVNAWPNDPASILNSFVRMDEYYSEDGTFAKHEYSNPERRDMFIKTIRIMESTLVKCALSYMEKVAEIESQAVRQILSCDHKIGDKAALMKTLEFYSNKAKSLEALVATHLSKKSLPKSTLKSMAAGVSWS